MNERIEQLAEEAGIAIWGDAVYMYHPKDTLDSTVMKKFAELIVRECSLVIRNGGYRKGAFGNEDLRPSEIATMIEEHFGVEE